MHLHVLFIVLSAYFSVAECTCRTGFESVGELVYAAETQLDKVFAFSNMVCPPCVNDTEFGCFINLLNTFKMDLDDLRTFEYSIIDSFLNSTCSYDGNTLFVGADNLMQTERITGNVSTNLPIIENAGIDCDLRSNLIVYANMATSEIIKTDGDGMNAMPVANGSGTHPQRPQILDPNTFYYADNTGTIFRVTNGVSVTIITNTETGGVRDFVLDPLEKAIYWTSSDQTKTSVFRADLDGQNIGTLFTDPSRPRNLDLASFSRRVYFTTDAVQELKYYDLRDSTMATIAPLGAIDSSDLSVCTNTIYISYPGGMGTYEIRDLSGTVVGPDSTPNLGVSNIVALATCNLNP